jgi:hypothetical protein
MKTPAPSGVFFVDGPSPRKSAPSRKSEEKESKSAIIIGVAGHGRISLISLGGEE